MILTSLFGTVLIVAVATGPFDASSGPPTLSAQQKMAATAPLVRSATECIVRAVAADPRYGAEPTAKLGDLIVASMPSCITPVRAMIDAYDRSFGQGSGEAFFMGPYLDVLPKAVTAGAKNEPEYYPRGAASLLRQEPNGVDHTHPGRVDEHDLVLHHRAFVELGCRIAGHDVIGQRVKIDHRRHLGADHGRKPLRRHFASVFADRGIDRTALRRRQLELLRNTGVGVLRTDILRPCGEHECHCRDRDGYGAMSFHWLFHS